MSILGGDEGWEIHKYCVWVLALNQLQSSLWLGIDRRDFLFCFCFPSPSLREASLLTVLLCRTRFLSSSPTKEIRFASSWLWVAVLDFTHTHPAWNLGFIFCLPQSIAPSFYTRRTCSPPYDLKQKPPYSYICLSSTLLQWYSRENTGNYSVLISA